MNKKVQALAKLMPLGGWSYNGDTVTVHEDGVGFGYSVPTEEQIAAAIVELELEEYKEKRKAEYPDIGDQLDALWKGGNDAEDMKALIDAVKSKYPKA